MNGALLLQVLIYVVGALGAMSGNRIIRGFLHRIRSTHQGETRKSALEFTRKSLPGGRWIGILERLATYVCVVAGEPMAIAMVLAVKGLGRYPELKNDNSAQLGELFIIGTFASILWALGWAGMATGLNADVEYMLVR